MLKTVSIVLTAFTSTEKKFKQRKATVLKLTSSVCTEPMVPLCTCTAYVVR